MSNRKPRGKFKMKIVNHPSLETPGKEQYSRETKFLAYKVPGHSGWLRLDINLQTSTPVKKLLREIGIRITEDINLLTREEGARILALRKDHPTWSAARIAHTLHQSRHRAENLIYRRKKPVER